MFRSQTGRAHLLLVSHTPGKAGGAIGVVTLEGMYSSFPLKYILITTGKNPDIIEVANNLFGLLNRATDISLDQEIILEEIIDETDQYQDNHTKVKARRVTTSTIMKG